MSVINPNRKKVLAQIGSRASNQLLSRMHPNNKNPILIVFLYQTLEELTDELIEIYDACLEGSYRRAKRDWEAYKLSILKTINSKLVEFKTIADIVLNDAIADNLVRSEILKIYPKSMFEKIHTECGEIIRPKHDKFYDFWSTRYSYIGVRVAMER